MKGREVLDTRHSSKSIDIEDQLYDLSLVFSEKLSEEIMATGIITAEESLLLRAHKNC